ncbi:M23 family metallopeptidase [Sphingomonas sp. SUN039]|uniref:M23 family metallopeptidase n=1 Tax=Sphingomonas sp. SUN039 TaxID=2937787 RepID=UPI002164C925|nr:M23 family metallopeptidase [Sphingomonas sp. SUN039]UVO55579.1 M23 family metallopeptidase [Sphingomonas sp. SUN039]
MTLTLSLHSDVTGRSQIRRPGGLHSDAGGHGLFQASENGFGGGGTAMLSLDRALPDARIPFGRAGLAKPSANWFSIDVLPDLGIDIGSRHWWRGLAACIALCATTLAFAPGFEPLVVPAAPPLSPAAWEESRAQSISPLAWGGDTGRHMAATDAVQPLADTPERPQIDLTAMLGEGDSLRHALERAGVGGGEASRIAEMTSDIVDPDEIPAGTALAVTLGRRSSKNDARPLQSLAFRARFDMRVNFVRVGNALTMQRMPVAVDSSPLRVEGRVGDSLYASARAAGAPAGAIQTYIRALAPHVPMENIGADDRFDLIVEQDRAATGEVRYGKLLYVGLARGNRATRMIQWDVDGSGGDGQSQWYDAAGVGERRAGFVLPVANARKTSGFGWRLHPLLGYSRMHQGTDYGAAYGTPIRAVTDGIVSFAGWHGGHGNMVQLKHPSGLGTGYAHMSRIAVAPGSRVAQGQVIGYVGSTGLSTGPHLHFEVYRGGVAVNPSGVSFESRSILEGAQLAAFRAKLGSILAMQPQRMQVAAR